MANSPALLAFFASLMTTQVGAPEVPKVRIEAKHFLENTGQLSENLLGEDLTYSGWNDFMWAAPARGRLFGSGDILVVTSVDTAAPKNAPKMMSFEFSSPARAGRWQNAPSS